MKNIIIIGARGYKSNYGGWETFVTNLIQNYDDKMTVFHVPELTHNKEDNKVVKDKDNVKCLQIYTSKLGFATMFLYAIKVLKFLKKYIRSNNLQNVSVYVLGCRVGPIYPFLIHSLQKNGVKFYLNPDGLEWTREKWAWWIKECFKISEHVMVKHSDAIICDSKAIQNYIDHRYQKFHKKTYFIPYGAYLDEKEDKTDLVNSLLKKYKIKENNYYLIVGRFVPENNYELIIREFMKTKTKKDLVIISNIEENKFYRKLQKTTHFEEDSRIKFIGPVYDKPSLLYFRKNAYAYIHGHSAGGTNPSLLESLATTKLNILFNAVYNVEVGLTSCLYFSRITNDLVRIIEKCEAFDVKMIKKYETLAKERIKNAYTWKKVVTEYKKIW